MKDLNSMRVLSDFIADRNRLAIQFTNKGFDEFIARYLALMVDALSGKLDSAELAKTRQLIENLSKEPDGPMTDYVRAEIYPFLRNAFNLDDPTRHIFLNQIVSSEVELLSEKLKAATSIPLPHYSIINSAEEFGALDACREARTMIEDMNGMLSRETYEAWTSQTSSAFKSLCDALKGGFPGDIAKSYWGSIEPKISEVSKDRSPRHFSEVKQSYISFGAQLAPLFAQAPPASVRSIDGALSMVLFAKSRISWMSSNAVGASDAGRLVSAREFVELENLLDSIASIMANEQGTSEGDFRSVNDLFDSAARDLLQL